MIKKVDLRAEQEITRVKSRCVGLVADADALFKVDLRK